MNMSLFHDARWRSNHYEDFLLTFKNSLIFQILNLKQDTERKMIKKNQNKNLLLQNSIIIKLMKIMMIKKHKTATNFFTYNFFYITKYETKT